MPDNHAMANHLEGNMPQDFHNLSLLAFIHSLLWRMEWMGSSGHTKQSYNTFDILRLRTWTFHVYHHIDNPNPYNNKSSISKYIKHGQQKTN